MTDRPDHPEEPPRDDALAGRIRALTGAIEAPASLRERIAGEHQRARPRRRRRLALPIGGLVAAAAVAVALLVGGGAAGPTIDDAAALALERPNLPAPKVDATNVQLVEVKIGDLQFPNYNYEWGRWRAIGHRVATIGGRDAKTVTYRGPLGDVGYAIVAGDPLPEPEDARHVTADGRRFAVVRHGDAVVVTWRRGGHTCVLAGRGKGIEQRLVSFAAWA
jgi:hypothetical protein